MRLSDTELLIGGGSYAVTGSAATFSKDTPIAVDTGSYAMVGGQTSLRHTRFNGQGYVWWWDGYEAQLEVILDDYRPAMCPFHELLRLLDRYPMKVEYKGGSTELQATTFVITTCERPELLWNGKTDEMIDQLIRRLTEIRQFHPDGTTTILKNSTTTYVKTPTDGSLVTSFRPFNNYQR